MPVVMDHDMTTEEDFTLYPMNGRASTGEEGLVVTYSSLTEVVLTLLLLVVIFMLTVTGRSIFTVIITAS